MHISTMFFLLLRLAGSVFLPPFLLPFSVVCKPLFLRFLFLLLAAFFLLLHRGHNVGGNLKRANEIEIEI